MRCHLSKPGKERKCNDAHGISASKPTWRQGPNPQHTQDTGSRAAHQRQLTITSREWLGLLFNTVCPLGTNREMPQGCWHTDGVSHESSSGGLAGFTKCSAHRRLKGPINRLLGQLPLDNSLGMLISPVFTHVFQKVSPVLTSYFCRYPEQSPPGKDSARPSIEPFGSSDLQRLSTWPGLTSTSQPTAPGVTDALNRPYTSWLAVPLSQKLAGRIAGPVDPKGFSQVHACRTPHLTYLLGRVNYYKKYLP